MSNIAIVGAGLVGRLLALLLAKQHVNVVSQISLFEKNELLSANATGRIAAGMVAPVAESVTASAHIMSMGQLSLQLWPQLLAFLKIDCACWQQGSIVLAHPQDRSNLAHFKQRLKHHAHESVRELDAAQLAELEPELAHKFQQGLYLPQEGHIDNQQLYIQTAQQIHQSNIQLFENSVVTILNNTICTEKGEQHTYDWVIDCRGVGASEQLIAPKAKLRGVRGEVISVRAPQVKLSRPVRVMHPRYPIYIVPKGNDQYVIGATEIESDSEQAMSVRSALELLSAAYSVHTGFAEAEILTMQTGLRPTLLDNEPSITVKNQAIQVNGLYRHGYLLAPYMLEQVLLVMRSFDQCTAEQWQIYTALKNSVDHRLVTVYEEEGRTCA